VRDEAGLCRAGSSTLSQRFEATAYATSEGASTVLTWRLMEGMASPGEPLEGGSDSFDLSEILAAGGLQAAWLNSRVDGELLGAICLWPFWVKRAMKCAILVSCTAKPIDNSDSSSWDVAGAKAPS
jgi:hypothetical protein